MIVCLFYLCPTQALIEAVTTRLRSCVDEDVFIPLYPKKLVFFLFHYKVERWYYNKNMVKFLNI